MLACLAVAAATLVPIGADTQFERTISATYDGWKQRPDGSYDLVFGYMNRNPSEIEVPIGPANSVEPGTIDQGQPANFLPGRQREAFHIHVPKDFKGKFVWTLTFAGTTQTANATLDQNYSLDVGEPDPPGLMIAPTLTVRVGEKTSLAPRVTAPPAPKESAKDNAAIVARQSRGTPITIWWSKFRGPGRVTFGDGTNAALTEGGPTGRTFPMGTHRVRCELPISSSCGATTVSFSAPGSYWLRLVAAERSESHALVKVQVTP